MIRPIKYLGIYAILTMKVLCMESAFAGEEKIGNLVFESLKKLDERQKQFTTASSMRKCNTWGYKGVTLSVYGETI